MENETREVTREELYNLVWSKSLVILAQEFGISDVGLAKICKRLNVPRPYRGYWALVAAGRKMSIPSLPPAKKDMPVKAFISPYVKPQPTIEYQARAALIETESLPANLLASWTLAVERVWRIIRQMSTQFHEVERQARALPPKEKAELARLLIAELDETVDADAERLWIDEAQRRYDSFLKGELEALPGEEVMTRARNRLK